MAAPKPAGRRKDRKPAGRHKRRRRRSAWAGVAWTYWRLCDRTDHVIGFMRTGGGVRHYIDLREDRWRIEPIEYAEAVRLSGELPGFAYLKDPEELEA